MEIARCMGQPIQGAEVEAWKRLGELMKRCAQVGTSLADLEERGRGQARAWRMRGAAMESSSQHVDSAPLGEEDKAALFHVLNAQRLGMERLGQIVERDVRDRGTLKEELSKATASSLGSRGAALPSSGATIFGGR